jgi:hypothetical protein
MRRFWGWVRMRIGSLPRSTSPISRRCTAEWLALGRSHGGLVYVSTTTFPQDRAFIGAMVASLDEAARAGALPGRHETLFLARVTK